MTKILFLGEIGAGQTSLMRMRALERLGHDVRGVHTIEPWLKTSWLHRQMQRRLHRGSVVDEINRKVLQAARDFRPKLVWAEKQEYLRYETLESMRSMGARMVHFTPDPYFSLAWKRTPLMDAALEAFDVLIYCKKYEHSQYAVLNKPLVYMPLGFCDEVHRPLSSQDSRWHCLFGFLGGWEPRRERLLSAMVASGADLKIWGGAWEFLRDGRWTPRRHIILKQLAGEDPFHIHRDRYLSAALQGGEVYADDYARALTGARIGLGFLRAVCQDQHTTRTFEIPACGSMLLADRTEEHQQFFEEGREAEFFSCADELVEKATFYAQNEGARAIIARRGRERCQVGRYAYVHRLSDALNALGRA